MDDLEMTELLDSGRTTLEDAYNALDRIIGHCGSYQWFLMIIILTIKIPQGMNMVIPMYRALLDLNVYQF